MPEIIREFHASLTVRVRAGIHDPDLPLEEPDRTRAARAAEARIACLYAFAEAGGEASEAAGDLIELMRRHVCENEYVGLESRFYRTLAHVMWRQPDGLLRILHYRKWLAIAALRVLSEMPASAAGEVGPSLIHRFKDEDDDIVAAAAEAMSRLEWSSDTAVESLRTRLQSVRDLQAKNRITHSLGVLESIAGRGKPAAK